MGLSVKTIEEVCYQEDNRVVANRNFLAEYHIESMDDYFRRAEEDGSIKVFWNEDTIFYQMFKELELKNVIELACGRGRHVPHYISKAENIVLVDILEKNINYCKRRFVEEKKVKYYVNDGDNLKELESGAYTALFTYDAMVHFEMLDIFHYLMETNRVLCRGGKALFHHSNCIEDYKVRSTTGRSGRNFMSKQLFAHLADRSGFNVLEQHVIDWGVEKDLDCITLVEKV